MSVPQDFPARGSARRERVGEPCNDRMGEAFFGHGRKRDAFDVDVRIRKDARHVIERRETDAGLSTDEQGVILAVSVRAGDQPVVRSGLKCTQIRVLPDRGTSIT
jgi:hypothetical protein